MKSRSRPAIRKLLPAMKPMAEPLVPAITVPSREACGCGQPIAPSTQPAARPKRSLKKP